MPSSPQTVFVELDQDRAEQLILDMFETDELEQDQMEEQGFFSARPAALPPSIATWLQLLPSMANTSNTVYISLTCNTSNTTSVLQALFEAVVSGEGINIAEVLTIYTLAGKPALQLHSRIAELSVTAYGLGSCTDKPSGSRVTGIYKSLKGMGMAPAAEFTTALVEGASLDARQANKRFLSLYGGIVLLNSK